MFWSLKIMENSWKFVFIFMWEPCILHGCDIVFSHVKRAVCWSSKRTQLSHDPLKMVNCSVTNFTDSYTQTVTHFQFKVHTRSHTQNVVHNCKDTWRPHSIATCFQCSAAICWIYLPFFNLPLSFNPHIYLTCLRTLSIFRVQHYNSQISFQSQTTLPARKVHTYSLNNTPTLNGNCLNIYTYNYIYSTSLSH